MKFQDLETPPDDVLLIYKIYFLLCNKSAKVIDLVYNGKDNIKLWSKIRDYFMWECKDFKLGNMVQKEISSMDFSDENIYNLRLFCKPHWKILTPLYYSKQCPTTGLFVFLIREILEYMGVVDVKKLPVQRKYKNLKYEMSLIEKKIEKINEFNAKLDKTNNDICEE